MSNFELSGLLNSSILFNHLLQNKLSLTIYLDDGTNVKGTLVGWDVDYFIIRDGETIQMIRAQKLARLQTELGNPTSASVSIKSEAPKPREKIKPVINEIKESFVVEESSEEFGQNKGHFKERLDKLVKNW